MVVGSGRFLRRRGGTLSFRVARALGAGRARATAPAVTTASSTRPGDYCAPLRRTDVAKPTTIHPIRGGAQPSARSSPGSAGTSAAVKADSDAASQYAS